MRLRLGGDRVEGDYTFELAGNSTTGPDCFWRTARLRVKEGEVVVLMELDFEGVSREDVEALSNDVGARENPPAGLIAHVVTDTASGVHAVDIWESAADFQRFNQEQLMPSTKKIAEERGLQLPDPPPVPRITEAYDLVRGS